MTAKMNSQMVALGTSELGEKEVGWDDSAIKGQ